MPSASLEDGCPRLDGGRRQRSIQVGGLEARLEASWRVAPLGRAGLEGEVKLGCAGRRGGQVTAAEEGSSGGRFGETRRSILQVDPEDDGIGRRTELGWRCHVADPADPRHAQSTETASASTTRVSPEVVDSVDFRATEDAGVRVPTVRDERRIVEDAFVQADGAEHMLAARKLLVPVDDGQEVGPGAAGVALVERPNVVFVGTDARDRAAAPGQILVTSGR